MLISGVFGLIIAKPFSMVVRFFPPLVAGTVIMMIGLSLAGADISLITGTSRARATSTSTAIGTTSRWPASVVLTDHRRAPGCSAASSARSRCSSAWSWAASWRSSMHLLDFSNVGHSDWVGLPKIWHFGHPQFDAAAIITMCIVMLVTYTESTADMLAVAEMVDKELSPNDLARGLATDGLSALLASFTNSFPDTAYAENVGLVGLTRVKSRWVVTICGVFLVVLGLIPKVGQIVADLPGPVIGGAATVMFAMVTAVGMQTLHKVKFDGTHNLLIVAVSLSVGLFPTFEPNFYAKFPKDFQTIFGSAITSTVIVVFILNLVFNEFGWRTRPEDDESALSVAIQHGAVVPEVAGDGSVHPFTDDRSES